MLARFSRPLTLLVAAAILLTTAARSFAAPPVTETLDNGMQVLVQESPRAPLVTVRIYVRVGSMYEEEYLGAGMSHFLEHLTAGGATAERSEASQEDAIASIGGQVNAYTTKDHTCYHITALSRDFDKALGLVADWVLNASITEEAYTRERGVIQREMSQRYAEPQTELVEAFDAAMFLNHPYRLPVIGFDDVFGKITRDQIVAFHQRWYTPNHMLLVVAGDVDARHVIEKARERFAKIPRGPDRDVVLPTEPDQVASRAVIKEAPVQRAYLMMGVRSVQVTSPDMYPLDLAAYVLANGPSSRLVQHLRDRDRLVDGISCWSATPGYNAGQFVVMASLDPAKVDAARRAIVAELDRLKVEPVTAEELAAAKRQKIADNLAGRETVQAQAEQLAGDVMSTGDAQFSDKYTERLQEVTAEQIQTAATKYFQPNHFTIAVLVPPKAAAGAGVAARPVAWEPAKYELPNGLRVIVKPNHDLAMVSMAAAFLGGVRADPAGKEGLGRLTADVMMRGAGTRSADDISRLLDGLGAMMGAASGNNSLYVTATCLKGDLPQVMDVFASVVRQPTFPAAEIDRRRLLQLAAIRAQADDIHATGMERLRQHAFAGTPYAHDALGTEAGVKALTRDDLVTMHRQLVGANNMVLAVCGDVDSDAVRAMVEAAFKDMPQVDVAKLRAPVPPSPRQPGIFQETTDKDVAMVLLGYPGMTLADVHDRAAMEVLSGILAGIGMPSGWLHHELRGRQLVYEVQGFNWIGYMDPGIYVVYALCQPEKTGEVLKVAQEQLHKALDYLPTPTDLEQTRTMSATAKELALETNMDQALDMALNELYGLGYDFSRKFHQAILAVQPEDVRAVARKFLHDPFVVVLRRPGNEATAPETPGAAVRVP